MVPLSNIEPGIQYVLKHIFDKIRYIFMHTEKKIG